MYTSKLAVCLPTVARPAALGGGHLNTVRFANLLSQHTEVQLVSYRERETEVPFLPDAVESLQKEGYSLVFVWGPDVTELIDEYYPSFSILYYMKSIDQGVQLKPDIPLLCNSKYLMGFAQEYWPSNPQFYLPPVLERNCRNRNQVRDIDVLIVRRKQPRYVLDKLAPRLADQCKLHVLDQFVDRDQLFELMNRAKVYLYAFDPQRTDKSPTGWRMMEGFGTQALEAMVCGCTVFSNLRGGMADFVEPWMHGYRLESHSLEWDLFQILQAVNNHPESGSEEYERFLQTHYDEAAFDRRAANLLRFLSEYEAFASHHQSNLDDFGFPEPVGAYQKFKEQTIGTLYRTKKRIQHRISPG